MVTSTTPAELAGLATVHSMELKQKPDVPATPPNRMLLVGPYGNPVPAILMSVPPVVNPLLGATSVTVGGVTKLYSSAVDAVEFRPAEVAMTSSTPSDPDGVVIVQDVLLEQSTPVARPATPNVNVLPARKPEPVTVIGVPPADDPTAGLTEVTVGPIAGTTCCGIARDWLDEY
jgi:hypothetical protein